MTASLVLCGCGVMGRRHVLGLQALRQAGLLPFDLVAVVDPIRSSAEGVADLAEGVLGRRPAIHTALEDALREQAVDAVSIVTSPGTHLGLAQVAFAHAAHVLVEKPIALTVDQGREMVAAAAAANLLLGVAENYRRDPINRLARALVDAGAIGRPTLAIQSSSGSGEQVIITPWRHRRTGCGIAVDMGVHYTDILEYLLGPIESVAGMGTVVDVERVDAQGHVHPADAEDLVAGVGRFRSGALANLLMNLGGRGDGHWSRVIHGTGGSLQIPMDRTGKPLRLVQRRDGMDHEVAGDDLLALVPGYRLDPVTAALFGGERLTQYERSWAEIDAALLGIEYADFAEAIRDGRAPEVDGAQGLRSLALMYGFLESDAAGRFITAEEALAGNLSCQREIDAALRGGE